MRLCSTRTPISASPRLAMRSARKIGSSVMDPCGKAKVHSPSQSSVPVTLIAGTLNRSSIASRNGHAVVGDVRTEDHQAALVDQLAIRIDHRLDRTLGQTLHLAIDHLYGPVHQALRDRLFEDEVESLGEGGEQLLGKTRRKREVHQVADLDRLGGAFVGHPTSRLTTHSRRTRTSRPNICSDPSGGGMQRQSSRPLPLAQIDLDHLVEGPAHRHVVGQRSGDRGPGRLGMVRPSATSRPAAMSTRVDATSRNPPVSSRRMA